MKFLIHWGGAGSCWWRSDLGLEIAAKALGLL